MPGHDTNQLLRDAVAASGVSQSELARRTGIPQGRISSYLSDRHHLTTPQLQRLLEPLGFDVQLSLTPTGRRRDVTRRWLLHRAVAEKLRTAPPDGWREQAGENLRRARAAVHGTLAEQRLDRWKQLIDSDDVPAVVEVLLRLDEDGEEMRALSPFAGLLSDEERVRLLAEAG